MTIFEWDWNKIKWNILLLLSQHYCLVQLQVCSYIWYGHAAQHIMSAKERDTCIVHYAMVYIENTRLKHTTRDKVVYAINTNIFFMYTFQSVGVICVCVMWCVCNAIWSSADDGRSGERAVWCWLARQLNTQIKSNGNQIESQLEIINVFTNIHGHVIARLY